MGTLHFLPGQMIPVAGNADNYPGTQTGGTAVTYHALSFDDSTDEEAQISFVMPSTYASGLTVTFGWCADSATSGDVVWYTEVAAITPNTDTGAVTSKTHDTANTATDSHLGTTAARLHSVAVTCSNDDSVAGGDLVFINIGRDANNGSDTLSGDADVVYVTVSWTDS